MASDSIDLVEPRLAPELVDRLTDAEHERLQALLRLARAHRAEEHQDAIAAAIERVPVLLRDTLRRILTE